MIVRQANLKDLSNCVDKNFTTRSVGLASGYFHPFLHVGHIKYIERSVDLCDYLIVVVNGINSTIKKYGAEITSIEDRLTIVNGLNGVGCVLEYDGEDMCEVLEAIHPRFFFNGGDRAAGTLNQREVDVCNRLGIISMTGIGGYNKADSNSDIMERIYQYKHGHKNDNI